jgi:hypothetical protein
MTLREALDLSAQGKTTGWLFLPSDYRRWTADVAARFVDLDCLESDPETDEPILPADCVSEGLRETIDADTIAECVRWADRLAGRIDPAIRLKSFIYYVRFDAPMPSIDAGEPPPWEETQKKLDLEFYDKLGPENKSQPCRHPGCDHGSIRSSLMCKRHHFEMIQKRDCPFSH